MTVSVKKVVLLEEEWKEILLSLKSDFKCLAWGSIRWLQIQDTIRAIEEQTGLGEAVQKGESN